MSKTEIRKLGVKSSGKGSQSYFVTLPKELVDELNWRKGQKLVVKRLDAKRLVVEDWKK